MFSAGQIDFEFKRDLLENTPSKGYMVSTISYTINRKTLDYTLNSSTVINFSASYKSKKADESVNGKCVIMKKAPTAGNKI